MAQTGYTPISIYYSATATNTPTAGNLVAGELAINTADGKLFYKDSSGVVQTIASKNGVAGGSNTQVQYNSSGSLAGSSNFVFDGTNVGIGATPSAWGGGYKAIQLYPSASAYLAGYGNDCELGTSAYFDGTNWKYQYSGVTITRYSQASGIHTWYTAPSGTAGNNITFTQAMMIDASGNVLVGTTSTNPITVPVVGNVFLGTSGGMRISQSSGASYFAVNGTTGTQINFYTYSGGPSLAGYINCPTSTTTAYVSVSDYRLKENIKPMIGALEKVALLKPCTYSWKHDGSDGQGFIAHELSEICSDAVVGKKDEVNEDGSIKPQGIDTSFLVATLTAAIQEQQALIESLTTRLTVLEAK